MKWSVAFAFLVAGAFVAQGADGPKVPAKEEIRAAAAYILSCDCGNSVEDLGYAEKSGVLEQAGAAVVPILTEMLADEKLSAWFVQNAAAQAGRYGFSPAFHEALRLRREDRRFDEDPGAFLGVYAYFARFGDKTDPAWMEKSLGRFDDRRRIAEESVRKLRVRLAER